jgi:hypothetical protein
LTELVITTSSITLVPLRETERRSNPGCNNAIAGITLTSHHDGATVFCTLVKVTSQPVAITPLPLTVVISTNLVLATAGNSSDEVHDVIIAMLYFGTGMPDHSSFFTNSRLRSCPPGAVKILTGVTLIFFLQKTSIPLDKHRSYGKLRS